MKRERLVDWAEALNEAQLRQLAVDLTTHLLSVDEVRFPEDALCPYWESCGDPLVEGQVSWPPEETEPQSGTAAPLEHTVLCFIEGGAVYSNTTIYHHAPDRTITEHKITEVTKLDGKVTHLNGIPLAEWSQIPF